MSRMKEDAEIVSEISDKHTWLYIYITESK